jgi:hypothetical protein
MFAALSRGQEATTPVAAPAPSSLTQENSTATVPHLIQFSGVLNPQANPQITQMGSGKAGAPATIAVTFSLYQWQEGGAPLWVESQQVALDEQGHYTVLLGATSPDGLPLDPFTSGKALWLGAQPELPEVGEQPRTPLVAVPYALKAADADTLGGKPMSAFLMAEGLGEPSAKGSTQPSTSGTAKQAAGVVSASSSAGSSGVPGYIPIWMTSALLGDSTIFESAGKVGIGNTTPAATLDVSGNAVVRGLGSFSGTTMGANTAILTAVQNGGENIQASPTVPPPPAAIVGKATSPTGFAAGVVGLSTGANSVAVVGYSTAPVNNYNPAVVGVTSGDAGTGIYGAAISSSGETHGVQAEVSSPDGAAGKFINDAGGKMIVAEAGSGSSRTIYFTVDSTQGTWVGGNLLLGGQIVAQSNPLTVNGNLHVTGTLSKGGGSFKIDHPLDPANKYLYHSFVESPDMMNIYNGNVVTDEKGEAEVVLPGYFEALNRDFRYQLTVIGQFAQAIVGTKIKNHRFAIRTDKPGVEVSWQVTGIRQDAYANAHRIQVEEDKPVAERGYYLHPELFGAPKEKGIEALHSAPQGTLSAASQEVSKAAGR